MFNGIRELTERIIVERHKTIDNMILGEIRQIATENGIDTKIVINEKAVISAFKRFTPQKPVIPWDSISQIPECPNCCHVLLIGQKFCNGCGQALEWWGNEKC